MQKPYCEQPDNWSESFIHAGCLFCCRRCGITTECCVDNGHHAESGGYDEPVERRELFYAMPMGEQEEIREPNQEKKVMRGCVIYARKAKRWLHVELMLSRGKSAALGGKKWIVVKRLKDLLVKKFVFLL